MVEWRPIVGIDILVQIYGVVTEVTTISNFLNDTALELHAEIQKKKAQQYAKSNKNRRMRSQYKFKVK